MRRRPLLAKLWQVIGSHQQAEIDSTEPFAYRAWKWLWQRTPELSRGSDLFERLEAVDWDVVILLDACRYDFLADVTTDAVVDQARSPASATPNFLSLADESGVFDGSVYVSGNPQSGKQLPGDVDHRPVYDEHWDDDLATVPPEPVYDVVREELDSRQRVVAHTLQPHYPHICRINGRTNPLPGGLHPRYMDRELHNQSLQALLVNGQLDLRRAQRSYERSVRFAWERASYFAIDLVDRGYRVVVTADHGELFGEWGFVEHPVDISVPAVRKVPWVVFEPSESYDTSAAPSERLAALGYVEN